MSDFKTLRKVTYCTPMDVRSILEVMAREVLDEDEQVRKQQELRDQFVEQHIYNADAIILAYLQAVYGAAALSSETPYFQGPIPMTDNSSPVALRGVVIASTAITEQWLVRFTAADTFSVSGTLSGAQGSGTIGADFTSTNSDVQIMSADWDLGGDSEVKADNQILFGTYVAHPTVRMLSAKLAASAVINSVYSISESKESGLAKSLRTEAMNLLKMLVDQKSDVSLNDLQTDDPIWEAVPWTINRDGSDVTEYGDYDNDFNPMNV